MFWNVATLPRRALFLVAGIGAGLAVSAVALATIPDSGGVIHACYKKSGGALRVIDDSVTNCAGSETSLNWNVAGQQGPQGPQGQPGVSGYEWLTKDFDLGGGQYAEDSLTCPAGKRVLTGGFDLISGGLEIVKSRPGPAVSGVDDTKWVVGAKNVSQGGSLVHMFALCANVAS